MAIIKCVECGHDVSTHADKCPNCGCPISVIIESANRPNQAVNVILEDAGKNQLATIRFIREMSIPEKKLSEAKNIIDNLPQTIIHSIDIKLGKETVSKLTRMGCTARIEISDSSEYNDEHSREEKEAKIESTFLFAKDTPLTCPRCGSSAVTTGSRGYSLVWGFIGSNKTVNRCGKCGHTWNP